MALNCLAISLHNLILRLGKKETAFLHLLGMINRQMAETETVRSIVETPSLLCSVFGKTPTIMGFLNPTSFIHFLSLESQYWTWITKNRNERINTGIGSDTGPR